MSTPITDWYDYIIDERVRPVVAAGIDERVMRVTEQDILDCIETLKANGAKPFEDLTLDDIARASNASVTKPPWPFRERKPMPVPDCSKYTVNSEYAPLVAERAARAVRCGGELNWAELEEAIKLYLGE